MFLSTFLNCSGTLLKNIREHFWKYSIIFLKIVLMFRNNVPKHYKNVPEYFLENVSQKSSGLNVLSNLFWKYCGTLFEIFRNTFEIVPEHFRQCSGTLLRTVLMFRNNVPKHFFELFLNTYEKRSGTLLKIFQNIFENRLNVSEQCSKTLVTMFRNTIEMFTNTIENIAKYFWNISEHFWKCSGTLLKTFRNTKEMFRNFMNCFGTLLKIFRNTFWKPS